MKRISWIDFGKGFTIFLVVFGHVLLGLWFSNRFENINRLILFFIELFYIFHIPVFFALSGYFFKVLNDWNSYSVYVKKKTVLLLLPLLFYSLLHFTLQQIGGGAVRDQAQLKDLLSIMWNPLGVSWFLHTLWIINVVYGFLSLILKKDWYLYFFSLVAYIVAITFPVPNLIVQRFLLWGFFFMLGSWLRKFNFTTIKVLYKKLIIISSITLTIIFMFLWWRSNASNYTSYVEPGIWSLIFVISVLFAFTLYTCIPEGKFHQYFVDKGKISLGIYVLHSPICSVVRIALFKIGITSLSIHIFVGLLAGWYLSIGIFHIMNRIPYIDAILAPSRYLKKSN